VPGFVTTSDLLLRVALLTGLGAVCIALLVFIGVLWLRSRLMRSQRRRAAFNARWRPVLARVAISGGEDQDGVDLPALASREQKIFLTEWNVLHDLLRGDAKPRLNRLAHRLGIDRYAWQLLRNRSLADQLLAAATLGHLQDLSAWDELLEMLGSDNTLVSLVSARALISIDPIAALPLVLPVIRDREYWSTPRVADLFMEAGAEAVSGPLEEVIVSCRPEQVPKLIAVLPEVALPVSERIVSRLLHEPTDDRIKSICLRIMGNPRDLPVVRELTTHSRWHVRMNAAVVLGRMGLPQDRDTLVAMLSDPEWWVRYRAAQALLAMPFLPLQEVAAIRDTVDDEFARDILDQVMAERTAC
jgi:hypothetical protein